MKKKIHFSPLTLKLLASAIFFGVAMGVINSLLSYREFKKQVENLYSTVTRQFAKTATSYIDSDRIFLWLTDGSDKFWDSTNARLNELTETAELAFIYLTVQSHDYKSRTYVFDTVNSLVLKEPYELGHVESLEKKTPEYIENLKKIIENGESRSVFSYKKDGGHVTTTIPVRDFTGQVVASLSVVKPMNEISSYKQNYIRSLLIFGLSFTLFFIAIYIFSLVKGLVIPLLLIIDETQHFAEHHGFLSENIKKIKNRDELGLLAKSVEKMSVDMKGYISDLTHATAEKERIGAELNVATKIQAEMLPRIFPPFDNHCEIELYATMNPAKEVGGDFYDFFMVDDDRFAVVVADVSGKGVGAALFMVVAKTLLKDASYRFKTPAEIFWHVNNILCENNESGLFVTAWMGILELSTGRLQFANAGHTMPLLKSENEVKFLKSKPNLMLAAMELTPYQNHEIKMNVGDRLFVYTDGVTEATNDKNELYGENRLLETMKMAKGKSPKEVLDFVRKDIDKFVDNAPQFDDITMLEMIVRSKSGEKKLLEMKLTGEEKNMEAVNAFVHAFMPSDCTSQIVNKIDLAVGEIFVNIAHYAYNPSVGEAWISASFINNVLTVIFKDNGTPFNPIAKEDPDITLSAEERDIGGLGIFLTKQFMDSVDYEYKDGLNVLTIKKLIQ